jgi:hypothetical protein
MAFRRRFASQADRGKIVSRSTFHWISISHPRPSRRNGNLRRDFSPLPLLPAVLAERDEKSTLC